MRPGPERDDLILSWLRLATKIANGYIRRARGALWAHADDVRATAIEGLVRAAHGYDPGRGVPFASYARRRIEGAVLDWLRGNDHLTRHFRQRAKASGVEAWDPPVSLEGITNWPELFPLVEQSPEDAVGDSHALDLVEIAARALPPRTRRILHLRYVEDLSQKEIGAILGVTEMRICQLLRAAHGAIREALGQPPAERSRQAPYSRRPRIVAPPAPAFQRVRRPRAPDGISGETREALRRSADERRARRGAARAG